MKKYQVTVNGTVYEVEVEEIGEGQTAPKAASAPAKPAAAPKPAVAPAGATAVKAPMQGNILKVNVKAGDSVKKGDVLVVLEAMKMENDIKAPLDGVIASVAVKQGDSVATDDLLLSLQ